MTANRVGVHPNGARVSIPAPGVAGQLRRARVVSKVRDTDAYVVAVTSGPDRGRRITVQGRQLKVIDPSA